VQEIRHDGSEKLTEAATLEDFAKAMEDDRNASVALHKPGARFKSQGVMYRVDQFGKLEHDRKAKDRRKAQRQSQRKARKRNR